MSSRITNRHIARKFVSRFLANRRNGVQRWRREKKIRIGKRQERHVPRAMCDVSCTLISGSFLHPFSRLSYPPVYAKIDPPAKVAVNAMEVRRTSLFWRTGERKKKEKKSKRETKGSRATILRDGRNLRKRWVKTKSQSAVYFSSPRLEILVFNDRPMGWEDRCVMCRSFS